MINLKKNIVIVDYGLGNIKSLVNAFNYIGAQIKVTDNKNTIKNADKIVLPGVGAFDSGIKELKKKKLFDTLNICVLEHNIPILGICLGMQLFFSKSEEGNESGFGWVKGKVKKIQTKKLRVPHMGWNKTEMNKKGGVFNSLSKDAYFYFVHSYCLDDCLIDDKYPKLTTKYEKRFLSAFEYKNLFACQFHPEKSQLNGLNVLKNFMNI